MEGVMVIASRRRCRAAVRTDTWPPRLTRREASVGFPPDVADADSDFEKVARKGEELAQRNLVRSQFHRMHFEWEGFPWPNPTKMDDIRKVSRHLEAVAADAISSPSHAVGVVVNVLLTLLILLFIATVLKRVTDRVVRVKAEGDEETFFSFFRSDFNVEAANKIVSAVGSYRPPWWYSANLGTMVAFGQDFDCHYDEEVVEAADGCRFIVSWFPRRPYLNGDLDGNPLETAIEGDVGRKQIALYVPGLGLHAESKVSKNYALRMARRGYTVGIVGVRGERLPLTCHKQNHDALLRPWHPALIDDLLATILRLHRLLPSESRRDVLDIFLTGYSAGGNIVQKTLQAIHRQNIRKEHAHPATTHRPSDASDDHEQQLVRGAFVLCLNFNYVQALRRLEQTLMGRVYSFFMCRVSTDILRKHRAELLQQLALAQGGGDDGLATEKMMDELFPADTAAGALSPSFLQMRWLLPPMQQLSAESTGTAGLLSAFDASVWRLRGFSSCDEQFQAFSMFDVDEIAVPTLMMQPRDDPLHLGDALRNIDLDALRRNPNLVFMSPRYGNHFGFYEGGLWQALMGTNRDCYSYPAKVSDCFFQSVLDHYHLRRAITRPCGGTAVYQLRSLQRQELQAHDLHLPDHPMSGPTAAPSEARPSRARKGTSRARSKSRGRARATETVAG